MNYLTYKEAEREGLVKIRKERCGTSDHVTFLQGSAVSFYILSENNALEYMGFCLVEHGEITWEIFFDSEDDFEGLKRHGFHSDMSSEEKANIIMKYF